MDNAIEEFEDQPHVFVIESYTSEQVKMRWGYDVDTDLGYAGASGMLRQNASNVATPGVGMPFSAGGAVDRQNRVTIYRLFSKLNRHYPDGCYIVMTASGKVLEHHKTYPWRRANTGKKYYPMVHFRFGTVGGRAWGYTPADDLLPKQYQLNKAESLFTLIMTRMANPVWLIPTSSNPSRITGEIGIQIEYTPVGQARPERVAGAEAPQSLVQYIADIRRSFDELSGAFDAVRGRSLGSRTPVGTVQTLSDRGFGRWATVFANLEEGYAEMAKKALEIWRSNANTPRVRAIKDMMGGYSFQTFMNADWDEGVDISVEAGSARPRTQQQKLQTYIQLAQFGLINIKDETQKVKILQDVGLSNLLPGVEEDTKAAYNENANFMEWARNLMKVASSPSLPMQDLNSQGVNQLQTAMMSLPDGRALAEVFIVQPLVDNHALHFLTHRRFALSQEFRSLPEMAKQKFYEHMAEHQQMLMMSMVMPGMGVPTAADAAGQGQNQNQQGGNGPRQPTPRRPQAGPQPPMTTAGG